MRADRALLSWDEYAEGWSALHGGFDPARASRVVRGWLRLSYRGARVLAAARVTPNVATAAGLVLALGVPLLARVGPGWALGGVVLIVFAALADSVDGALAVITRSATRLGYVLDSVADRLAEVAWLVALWALGAPGWLTVGCGAASWLHEYARARATGAGMTDVGVVTVAERPTRVIVAAFGLCGCGVAGLVRPDLVPTGATVTLAVWAALAVAGLAQLAAAIRRALR